MTAMKLRFQKVMEGLSNIPLLNADIVTGVAIMLLFVHFMSLGFTSMLIAHVTLGLPYIILNVMPRFQQLDKNVYEELEIETNILGFSLDDNNPLKTISNKSVPILIIHGTSDTVIDVSNAISLYNKCKHPNSRMELFEGREHALAIMDSKRYEDVVEEFIQKI